MTDDEFRDLQERSLLIQELTSHPGWELLGDRARLTLFKKQQWLILGRADSHESYKTACAWMDGVSFILDLPNQVQAELDGEVQLRGEKAAEGAGE